MYMANVKLKLQLQNLNFYLFITLGAKCPVLSFREHKNQKYILKDSEIPIHCMNNENCKKIYMCLHIFPFSLLNALTKCLTFPLKLYFRIRGVVRDKNSDY